MVMTEFISHSDGLTGGSEFQEDWEAGVPERAAAG